MCWLNTFQAPLSSFESPQCIFVLISLCSNIVLHRHASSESDTSTHVLSQELPSPVASSSVIQCWRASVLMCRDTDASRSLHPPPDPTVSPAAGADILVPPVANWSLQYPAHIYGHLDTWIPNLSSYSWATLPHTPCAPTQVFPAGTWTTVTHSPTPVAGRSKPLRTEVVSACPT